MVGTESSVMILNLTKVYLENFKTGRLNRLKCHLKDNKKRAPKRSFYELKIIFIKTILINFIDMKTAFYLYA